MGVEGTREGNGNERRRRKLNAKSRSKRDKVGPKG